MSARVLAPPPHQGRVPHARPPGVRDGQQGLQAAPFVLFIALCRLFISLFRLCSLRCGQRRMPCRLQTFLSTVVHTPSVAAGESRGWGRGEVRGRHRPSEWQGFRWEEVHLRRPRWADGTAARSPECLATSSMALSEHADPLRPLTCARPPQGSSLFCDSTGTTRRVRVSLRGPLCSIHPPLDRAARAPVRPACVAERLSRRRLLSSCVLPPHPGAGCRKTGF